MGVVFFSLSIYLPLLSSHDLIFYISKLTLWISFLIIGISKRFKIPISHLVFLLAIIVGSELQVFLNDINQKLNQLMYIVFKLPELALTIWITRIVGGELLIKTFIKIALTCGIFTLSIFILNLFYIFLPDRLITFQDYTGFERLGGWNVEPSMFVFAMFPCLFLIKFLNIQNKILAIAIALATGSNMLFILIISKLLFIKERILILLILASAIILSELADYRYNFYAVWTKLQVGALGLSLDTMSFFGQGLNSMVYRANSKMVAGNGFTRILSDFGIIGTCFFMTIVVIYSLIFFRSSRPPYIKGLFLSSVIIFFLQDYYLLNSLWAILAACIYYGRFNSTTYLQR
jgi:hypothetical protein